MWPVVDRVTYRSNLTISGEPNKTANRTQALFEYIRLIRAIEVRPGIVSQCLIEPGDSVVRSDQRFFLLLISSPHHQREAKLASAAKYTPNYTNKIEKVFAVMKP